MESGGLTLLQKYSHRISQPLVMGLSNHSVLSLKNRNIMQEGINLIAIKVTKHSFIYI